MFYISIFLANCVESEEPKKKTISKTTAPVYLLFPVFRQKTKIVPVSVHLFKKSLVNFFSPVLEHKVLVKSMNLKIKNKPQENNKMQLND